jgi:hypothetical protein
MRSRLTLRGVQAPEAGLRPCTPTRGKPRPVFLSRSPFPPRSGANGSRHAESAPRHCRGSAHTKSHARDGRAHRTAASAGITERSVPSPNIGVGCPAKRRKRAYRDERPGIFAEARGAETMRPRGRRVRSATHHWWRSAVSLAEDGRTRPTHNHGTYSRAQRARKEARGKTPPWVFSRWPQDRPIWMKDGSQWKH